MAGPKSKLNGNADLLANAIRQVFKETQEKTLCR